MPFVGKLRAVSSKTGHTRSSSLLRFFGQWLVLGVGALGIPLLAGKPWAAAAFVGTATLAAVTLLLSAALRNIEKWRRQAAFGQEPQTISILAHACSMAIPSLEQMALFSAEWRADEEFDRRFRERRRQAKQAARKDVEKGSPSAAPACPITPAPLPTTVDQSTPSNDGRIYLENLDSKMH